MRYFAYRGRPANIRSRSISRLISCTRSRVGLQRIAMVPQGEMSALAQAPWDSTATPLPPAARFGDRAARSPQAPHATMRPTTSGYVISAT